jgi:hypothetical protein
MKSQGLCGLARGSRAARRLDVHRRLLYEKIRKLGLDDTDQILEDETLDSNGAPRRCLTSIQITPTLAVLPTHMLRKPRRGSS